jgi:hypothetical protein
MPPGSAQAKDDLFIGTRSSCMGKGFEFYFKEGNADTGGQMEEGTPRGRMDKAHEIAPGEAMAHRREGTLPDRCPHPTKERFQANAVLVERPQFDLGPRKGARHCPQQRPHLFLPSGQKSRTHAPAIRGAQEARWAPVGMEALSWGSRGGACRCARPNGIPCWHARRFVPS